MRLLITLVGAWIGAATGRPACSIGALPVFRDPAATYLVGVATPDSALAAAGGPRVGLRGRPPEPPRAAFGQVVRVGLIRGPDSLAIERVFARLGAREAVVVPWAYDPSCSPMPWSAGAPWAPIGVSGAYQLRLRAADQWGGARPVLDALVAELQPYPHGLLAPAPGEAALSVEQFVDLYAGLPSARDASERPATARRALAAWERAHPQLATRFPAAAVLRNARATLAARSRPGRR
jgi:hypothetical protein